VGSDGKNYSKVSVVAEHVEFKPIFAKKEKGLDENELDLSENPEKEVSEEAIPVF
jgi:single-strand DNA-binding protein